MAVVWQQYVFIQDIISDSWILQKGKVKWDLKFSWSTHDARVSEICNCACNGMLNNSYIKLWLLLNLKHRVLGSRVLNFGWHIYWVSVDMVTDAQPTYWLNIGQQVYQYTDQVANDNGGQRSINLNNMAINSQLTIGLFSADRYLKYT